MGTTWLTRRRFLPEAIALNELTIAQTVLFPDLADRPLIATLDHPHASSDGGAILLKAVRLITIDLDVTEDQTHGAQQLTFFHGFYHHWCYLPLVASLTFDREARQYLVAAIIRPGNAAGTDGAVSLLHRLLPKLGRAFPGARLRVQLDAGFATLEIFAHLEAAGVEYVVAMETNTVLARHAEPYIAPLRPVVTTTHDTATTYGEAAYQAGTPTNDHQSRSRVAPWARTPR